MSLCCGHAAGMVPRASAETRDARNAACEESHEATRREGGEREKESRAGTWGGQAAWHRKEPTTLAGGDEPSAEGSYLDSPRIVSVASTAGSRRSAHHLV